MGISFYELCCEASAGLDWAPRIQRTDQPDLDDFFDKPSKKQIRTDSPKVIPYMLELYRGFDLDWGELEQEGQYYVLSPKKSEQGLIWFTHQFIVHYNPVEYAESRGKYLLTYPLKCKRHIQTNVYDDGTTYNDIPQKIQDKTNPYENSSFHMGIELPEGWVFSYKMEKFIGCSIDLRVTKNMIRLSEQGDG